MEKRGTELQLEVQSVQIFIDLVNRAKTSSFPSFNISAFMHWSISYEATFLTLLAINYLRKLGNLMSHIVARIFLGEW